MKGTPSGTCRLSPAPTTATVDIPVQVLGKAKRCSKSDVLQRLPCLASSSKSSGLAAPETSANCLFENGKSAAVSQSDHFSYSFPSGNSKQIMRNMST